MSLKTTIDTDLKIAMKAKDEAAKRTLRAIKSAILLVETEENRSGPLTEKEELQLLIKQAKQRKDSLDQYRSNSREDLAAKEEEELAVLEKYLPKQLTEEELTAKVKEIIASVGASSVKDMGKVMGVASSQLNGKVDGKVLAGLVRQLLNS